jgi:hypothetical protein
MRLLRTSRWILLALLLTVIPASSFAGIIISVGFAPPVLPVYEQPLCPEPGLMWSPGYWAYGEDGYYWVPGAWVPAPYEGALWTPPYWGWEGGHYLFHDGYWGRHVGYYGGVNYGFGYMGIGFVGGEWRGHDFAYNTAVMRVNRTVIRNTYDNTTIVHNNTIVNNHVAYSGGPGGVRHQPTPQERTAMHESHVAPTSFQKQHIQAARSDRTSYVKANNGHPQTLAVARPLNNGGGRNAGPANSRPSAVGGAAGVNNRPQPGAAPNARPAYQQRPNTQPGTAARTNPANEPRTSNQGRPMPESRTAPTTRNQPESRPAPQSRPAQGNRPQTESRPVPQRSYPQSRPAPESRPSPQSRPAPESRPAPQSRPAPEARPAPQRAAPQERSAPAPRQQEKPSPKEPHGR